MTKTRMFLVFLVVMLASLAVAQADSTDRAILCGDLAETDCQILLDNEDVMNSLNSFAFVMSMNLNAGGDDPMLLAMQGGGALSLGDEALQAANAMSTDMSDSDMSALIELLLTSIEGEVWFELQGSSAEEEFDMELVLRMKDGIVLLGAEALEAMTGQEATGIDAFGIDLNDAIGEVVAETGTISATDVSDMDAMEAAATTITRLPDGEVNGVAVAVFETEIDLNTLLSLVSAEELVAASDDVDDPEMAKEIIDAIDVREFTLHQYIGLGDSYTYRVDMALDMILDEGADLGADASIIMDMTVDLSDFNEPVEVEIPEDAFIFPLAMMMQMGSQ